MQSVDIDEMRQLANRVQSSLDAVYEAVGEPEPGSAPDQLGLLDGARIVEAYLEHGEYGLAFEHQLYMIEEP